MARGPGSESARKKRKIRKGTASGWECKRRKVRCSLVDNPGGVCTACRRRGTKCLTQDHEIAEGEWPVGDQDGHVAPIDQPVRTETPACTITPTVTGSAASPQHQSAHANVSQELYLHLPSREDADSLRKVVAHVPISFHTFIMTPYRDIERDGRDEASMLLAIPTPDSHPVLLARYMLRVAMILQPLDLKISGKQLIALSDAPQLMTKRLAETAIRLVTSRDELLSTVESLECVMMEGGYHANCGNFRPAWIAFRKAMTLAQMMGIHRPGRGSQRFLDPRQKINTSFLWYRIVYIDRFMCLMMGLPQGSRDRSMATEAALAVDTPLGRLERVHCVIASRILERNESDPVSYPTDTTQEIDHELQKAAEMMPSGWWAAPAFASHQDTDNNQDHPPVNWDILRLVTQLYHYGLINQLHIPFMLRFTTSSSLSSPQLNTYSQTACVTASRSILTRYTTLPSSNHIAHTNRVADFFTLSSAFLLLISHLHQHARPHTDPNQNHPLNPLAHHRQPDRDIISQAITALQKVAWTHQDRIIAKSADLLTRLLDIEAEAARGHIYSTHSIGSPEDVARESETENTSLLPGAVGLRFCIPYFGFVRVVPAGVADAGGGGGLAGPESLNFFVRDGGQSIPAELDMTFFDCLI
ncbi:hypothetical protein BJX76DRAFT_345822 [Aspergillus varians]